MSERTNEEGWRKLLTGEAPGMAGSRRFWKLLPSEPRCKLCSAPYGAPGSVIARILGARPSPLNRRVCKWCISGLHDHPGGAEVEISLLFADVRGSTALAETMPPEQFSRLLARFYGTAASVVDDRDGIVDKFVGDAAVALFIPGMAGQEHAAAAVDAARELLRRAADGDGGPWVPVGIGVHTGVSYVGVVGEGDALDFTALGDTVNITARLSDCAAAGEIVLSEAAAKAAGLDTAGLERRTLTLRGREQTVDAWVLTG